jgi:hypothetical protein
MNSGILVRRAPMAIGKTDHSVQEANGSAFITLGGTYRNRPLARCEVYNTELDKWNDLSPLTTADYGIGTILFNGPILYIFGGVFVKDRIEQLDIVSDNVWVKVPMILNGDIVGSFVCVEMYSITEVIVFGLEFKIIDLQHLTISILNTFTASALSIISIKLLSHDSYNISIHNSFNNSKLLKTNKPKSKSGHCFPEIVYFLVNSILGIEITIL